MGIYHVYNSFAILEAVLLCTVLCTTCNVTPKEQYSSIGATVNLTCNLNMERMYITWLGPPGFSTYAIGNEVENKKTSTVRLQGNEDEKHHILQIIKMQENDEGLYKCTVPDAEECVQLIVKTEQTVKIIPGGTIDTIEDKALVLKCMYTSNDKNNTSISWKYTSDVNTSTIDQKNLKLQHIKRSDAGNYTCLVSNTAGKAEDTVTVNVLYPPTVNITLHKKQLDKMLTCNADGNPADYIFSAWEHTTDVGDHVRFLNDSGMGSITLQSAFEETDKHLDQGIYICNVSNGIPYNGNINRFANYTLKQEGSPYFSTINNINQYGILGKENILTLKVVSYPKFKNVTVLHNQSLILKDVNYKTEPSRIEDIVYGKKVNINGYKLFVRIKTSVPADFMIYSIVVTNDYGSCNISVDFRSARKQFEESPSYTTIVVTISLLIIIIIVSGTLIYRYFKKGNLVRNVDLGCMKWTSRRNAVEVQGMENGIYDMQNNLAPGPAAQSNDSPIYSSIDRKHKLSIGQAVSYSVTKKTKKPHPLTGRHRRRNKDDQQTETDFDMSTSQAEDNNQLNYVDVCFDPKPVGHHFEIHGMDQKSEYVDIDFSKSINILPNSEKLDGSDEDFSSVEDVIAMKRDMML